MTSDSTLTMEFIWRRLSEPAEWFGRVIDMEPRWWLGIGLPVLLVAILWTLRSYLREGRTVGRGWAWLLAGLRCAACLLVFIVWLLPAMRPVETSVQESRVLVLHDVSASMQVSDDPPPETLGPPRISRQDRVLELLVPRATPRAPTGVPGSADEAHAAGPSSETPGSANAQPARPPLKFLDELLERNPLSFYRFGEMLDPRPWVITRQQRPTSNDWTAWLHPSPVPPLSGLVPAPMIGELGRLRQRLPSEEMEGAAARRERLADDLERWLRDYQQTQQRLLSRTRLGVAVRDVLRRESAANVQGLIVVSDGRVTAGAEQDIAEAVALARRERIPVFAIGVGRPDPLPNLRLVDILAPARIQPDDPFPVRVVVEGDAVPASHQAKVILRIEKPKGDPVVLDELVTLAPTTGLLSRGVAEFRVENPDKLKGDWRLTALVEPLPGERTRLDNRSEEPTIVKVDESKLNVLLFSSGPSREYQFLRALLTREPDKFDLTICLQSALPGSVQDVQPARLLDRFPTELRVPDEDPMNLGRYDVIVALDPDWRQVPTTGTPEKPSPQANLRRWVEQFGGGLVLVAGPVNTFSLARSRELTDILHLYPVIFDDSVSAFDILDKPAKEPFAVNWDPAATGQAFLNLTDATDPRLWLEGWEDFFEVKRHPETGLAEGPARRGFFSCFPLRSAKEGATVLARFADPDRKTTTGQRQPLMVLGKAGKGQVLYLGTGETYRLRQYSDKYHELFWTKLVRQLGKRETARGLLLVGSRFTEGETVAVEVELVDAALQPLSRPEYVLDLSLRLLDAGTPPQPPLLEMWEEAVLAAAARALGGERPLSREGAIEALQTLRRNQVELATDARFTDAPELRGPPGRFYFRLPAPKAGSYRLERKVPGSRVVLTARFRVEAPDPELDDTRPDFATLHRLASPMSEAVLRDRGRLAGLTAALQQSRMHLLGESLHPSRTATTDAAGERLLFTLESAPWITECLDSNPVTFRTEGQPQDIWDKGFSVFWNLDDPKQASGPPWALVTLIVLLGSEWLIRKLLPRA
ncbi:MAG TPA: VWA domain-containing protein [Gemmatales bacterium]|nr:VWA domain-containing protein [Gemmatales bacterium]